MKNLLDCSIGHEFAVNDFNSSFTKCAAQFTLGKRFWKKNYLFRRQNRLNLFDEAFKLRYYVSFLLSMTHKHWSEQKM